MSELMKDVLTERVGDLVAGPDVLRKNMFGAACFMLNGNMLVCVSKRGLMARVGKDNEGLALSKPYASPCRPAGRPMPGFIEIAFDGVTSDTDLEDWVGLARSYVGTLPPKPAKG